MPGVEIRGITLRDSANWVQHYLNCDDLILQDVHVESHANWNNDGIDIDACRNVLVRGCFVNSEDDGLCFKNSGTRALENVLVEGCKFYSTCNAIKFGTASQGSCRSAHPGQHPVPFPRVLRRFPRRSPQVHPHPCRPRQTCSAKSRR